MWQPFLSRSRSIPDGPEPPAHGTLERLEDRQLLSYADFELSSLLPANGGDGSTGFVVDGIVDEGKLGNPALFTNPSATSIAMGSTTCWSPHPAREQRRLDSSHDKRCLPDLRPGRRVPCPARSPFARRDDGLRHS